MGTEPKGRVPTAATFVMLLILAVIIGVTDSSESASGSAASFGVVEEAGEAYVLVNAPGGDAYLLADPAGRRVRYWPNGTTVIVVGPDKQVAGAVWKNVKDPDGNVGWVPGGFCFRWLPGSWVAR